MTCGHQIIWSFVYGKPVEDWSNDGIDCGSHVHVLHIYYIVYIYIRIIINIYMYMTFFPKMLEKNAFKTIVFFGFLVQGPPFRNSEVKLEWPQTSTVSWWFFDASFMKVMALKASKTEIQPGRAWGVRISMQVTAMWAYELWRFVSSPLSP